MSSLPPENTPGPIDQLALRYLRQALDPAHPIDEPFVMSELENQVIGKIRRQTLFMASALGMLGAVALYLPQYLWPGFFAPHLIEAGAYTFSLPIVLILYSFLLVYLETYAMLFINTRAVRYTMAVCQFPRHHDAQYERHLYALADAVREHTQLRYAFAPYIGLPNWALTAFFGANKVNALLSNAAVQWLLWGLASTSGLGQLAPLASLPIFALWNAWASNRVMHEAKIRIMAPLTIREFVDELYEKWRHDEAFCQLIPEALEYVAILRRPFNYAHLLLTETLMDRFGLRVIKPTGHFLDRLTEAPAEVRQPLERLVIFGVLIDGSLSWFERRRLRQLQKHNNLSYSIVDIQQIGEEYYQGRGLWV